MINSGFIWLALALTVFGAFFYIRDTLKGETQPNRVTFFLWGVAPLVAYFSQRAEHVGIQALYTLTIASLALVIFAASFMDKKAYWKITKFDIACGIVSVVALIFLIITGNGAIALGLSILADFFACLPTIIKSYKHPSSETPIAYVADTISAVIVLLTIQHRVFVNYIFPAYVLFTCLVFVVLLTLPRKKIAKKFTSSSLS